jgi:hypothetical protein
MTDKFPQRNSRTARYAALRGENQFEGAALAAVRLGTVRVIESGIVQVALPTWNSIRFIVTIIFPGLTPKRR